MARSLWLHPAVKPLVAAAAALPLLDLLWRAGQQTLGPNPAEALIRGTGDWTLRLLWLTLAITPLRRWTGQHALARFRRMLGLWAAFYALLHLLAYTWLDMGFELDEVWRDLGKRPFVLVGSLAALLMLPLAATSFNRAVRALGAQRWQRLHRSVYLIALLGWLHFLWMRAAKQNFQEVAVYGVLLAVLMLARLPRRNPLRRSDTAAPPGA